MTKSNKTKRKNNEPDSAYLLKLVIFLIIGAQWVRFVNPSVTVEIPIPIGLIVGLFIAMHDHFRIDRKIEYAVLLVAMLLGFWSQSGIYLTVLK
ncbi:MAG: hypothetical protein WCK69_00180 [Candidatus Saccharibacteria bacterium]